MLITKLLHVLKINLIKSQEKSSVNKHREKKSDSSVDYINLAVSSLKKTLVGFFLNDGNTQWMSIYEVIDDLFLENGD